MLNEAGRGKSTLIAEALWMRNALIFGQGWDVTPAPNHAGFPRRPTPPTQGNTMILNRTTQATVSGVTDASGAAQLSENDMLDIGIEALGAFFD